MIRSQFTAAGAPERRGRA